MIWLAFSIGFLLGSLTMLFTIALCQMAARRRAIRKDPPTTPIYYALRFRPVPTDDTPQPKAVKP